MSKINCEICMDLIPLVQDGVASQDSCQAVQEHLEECESCRRIYHGEEIPPADSNKIYQKLRHKMQLLTSIMMMAMFFGLGLTAQEGMFYNILIMPIIGVLGYLIWQWKAAYNVPLLLVITHLVTHFFGMFWKTEQFGIPDLLIWTGLYAVFAVIGVCIAGLLHFVFRKEERHEK